MIRKQQQIEHLHLQTSEFPMNWKKLQVAEVYKPRISLYPKSMPPSPTPSSSTATLWMRYRAEFASAARHVMVA
jgi:hypothetical protein